MLYLFLSKDSEEVFERLEKLSIFFLMVNLHGFCLPYKSLFEHANNCWSRSFCRANTSLPKCDIQLSCSFYPTVVTVILSRPPFNVKRFWSKSRFFKNKYLEKKH